nr:disease resistance protein Pik-1-like [Setaria viridis]
MTEILGTILSQVADGAMSAGSGTEPAAEQNIINDISISLSDKRAKEDNFVACRQHNNGRGSSSHAKQIRRLSLDTDCIPDEDVVSHIRSLAVLSDQPHIGVPLKKFKNLRVLEIDSCKRLENFSLVDIYGLIWLRYLGLNGCLEITEIPREIWRLQNLETLEVRNTEVPRKITGLSRLENLDVSSTGVKELPKEVGKLQELRTLDIRVTKVISSSGANCRESLSILVLFNHLYKRCEVLPVPMHRVAGRHMKVPQWVKQDLCNVCSLDISLCKLVEEDLEFLKTQMPNLQALQLRFEVLPREPVAITGGGFLKLETFYVCCRLPRVITFWEGAMPKLKHLEFKFCTGTARQHYSMGIRHLDSLEKVMFRCSEYYTSHGPGIRETIDVLRKEAAEHPNKITLWVNNMKPEVFLKTIDVPFKEWKREQRLRLSTAAEVRELSGTKTTQGLELKRKFKKGKAILKSGNDD